MGDSFLRRHPQEVQRFLRQRALTDHDGEITYYEAVVRENDMIRVQASAGGELSVLTLAGGPRWSGRKGPYR